MLVVSDIMDMFVPLSDGFFVDPVESRQAIEALLDSLPALAEANQIVEAALGAPLQAAAMAMVRFSYASPNLVSSCADERRRKLDRRGWAARSTYSRRSCRRSDRAP